jgi:transposase-like protein
MAKIQNRTTKNDEVISDLPMACADEQAAVEFMEKQRWGGEAHCPHCGDFDVYQMRNSKTGQRQANYRWRCNGCKAQFTVRIGTVLEDSRIPLRHWCFAFWRAATSKKGVSALEIHRQTGLSYKSCLFLLNRIRHAMDESPEGGPLTGTVEVDEVYIGGKLRNRGRSNQRGQVEKHQVVAMLERGGRVRAKPVARINGANLKETLLSNVSTDANLMTDESVLYRRIGKQFASHQTVNHAREEYSRDDVTTNRVEGFFSLLRRSIDGIYHSVSREHLQKYLDEATFRYTHRDLSDGQRTVHAIKSAVGKRLTYVQSKAS